MLRIRYVGLLKYLIIILLLTSCEEYLTIEDVENKTISEGYFDSEKKVEQAITGSYISLRRGLLNNYAWLMYGDVRAGDLFVDVDYSLIVENQDLNNKLYEVRQLTDWSYFYDAIYDANSVLEWLEKSDASFLTSNQSNLFKGEALALKSISYFYLIRIWGDVLSAEKEDFGKMVKEYNFLDRVISWSKEAVELLPWMLLNDDGIISSALTEIRFNKTAAYLLLAHEQLWRGDFLEAYNDLSEGLLVQSNDSLSSFGLSLGKDNQIDIPADIYSGNSIGIKKKRLAEIYPMGDERRSKFNIPTEGDSAYLIIENSDILPLYNKKEVNLILAEIFWKVGEIEQAKSYLLKASEGAIEDFNDLTMDSFERALLIERQRILIGSGQRFFDLLRFNKVASKLTFYDETDLEAGAGYWPLSEQSRSSNDLQQNKFWKNK